MTGFVTFIALGHFFQFRKESKTTKLRWLNNLVLTLFNSVLLRVVAPITLVTIAHKNEFGLFSFFEAPILLKTVLTVLTLDLAIYLQHILTHKVPFLWRLHRVHHTDPEFDASTALRFHPLETLFSFAYKLLWILALGGTAWGVLISEIILNFSALFNHSNFKLNTKIENSLKLLFVTPSMHRVHHSTLKEETDSNYGFFLSIWDKIFKTYKTKSSEDPMTMKMGLKAFRTNEDQRIDRLLIQPFKSK